MYSTLMGGTPFGWKDVAIAIMLFCVLISGRILLLVTLRPMLNRVGNYEITFREGFVLSWSGMPGSASMMFILLLAAQIEDEFESAWLVFITGLVILISQIAQGCFLIPVMDWVGMGRKKGLKAGLESFAMDKYRKLTAKALELELASAEEDGYDIENIKDLLKHLQCFKDAERAAENLPLVSSNRDRQIGNEEDPETVVRTSPLNDREKEQDEVPMFVKNLITATSSKRNLTKPSFNISTTLRLYTRNRSRHSFSTAFGSSTYTDAEEKESLLVGIRTIFLKSLRATYWDQIRNGTIPKGTTTARSMLGATEICLDRVDVSISDFSKLKLPEVGLHGSRFKRCVDRSLSKVEESVSYCFPALFQDLAARTVHGALGEAAFRATCLISGHMYARTTLVQYILNESKSYKEAREIMEGAASKMPELKCVLQVLDESQRQINQAKEYLKEIKAYAPDIVAVVETKKIISMVLEEQRSFAKQLHNQGMLSDNHHHDLLLFLREDQRKLKRMKIGPSPIEVRKASKVSARGSAVSIAPDGDVVFSTEDGMVDIDLDRTDFFDKIKEESNLAKEREERFNKILPAEEQE
mmetsp:Transcript_17100/g.21844  ORF Transcript_17100/g.21844 Transcript_17100/m.21844 type:complete len:584 (-) Transcript_17100:893-2644(-)